MNRDLDELLTELQAERAIDVKLARSFGPPERVPTAAHGRISLRISEAEYRRLLEAATLELRASIHLAIEAAYECIERIDRAEPTSLLLARAAEATTLAARLSDTADVRVGAIAHAVAILTAAAESFPHARDSAALRRAANRARRSLDGAR